MYPQQKREISSGLHADIKRRSISEISFPKQRTGAGLPAGRAMNSETVPGQIGRAYTFNIFQVKSIAKTLHKAMSNTLSR